jgi:MoxR-like ATPase
MGSTAVSIFSIRRTTCSISSRARALIHGRDFVVPDDLFALAEDCLLHRMRLSYEALADGKTTASVLEELLTEVGANKSALAKA